MKLAEAWHLSQIPYREVVYRSLAEERGRMWWGAFGQNHSAQEGQDDLELTKKALRIAKFDKFLVAIFSIVVSIVPFVSVFSGAMAFGLASSISLSLGVTFGLTALYAIQTFSSFVSAESSVLLSTLPIARDDFSLVTLFSFIRSVDYIVVGAAASQILAVAYLTVSPVATLIMILASAMNAVFAVTIALWFSRIFQKNLMRGGQSKINTVLRLGFILMWGVLLVGVGFLFSIPSYIVPNLESTLLGAGQASNLILGLFYPFSTGIIVTSTVSSGVGFTAMLLTSTALTAYALLAIGSGKWILRIIRGISEGAGVKIARVRAVDFTVKVRRPLLGYMWKDLKIASRNPATAFFFALPVLESVIITLLVSNYEALRAVIVLDATAMGGIFALFLPLALLSSEGKGLEYTKTLPIGSRKIIVSKTIVSTATYVPVPLAMVVLSLFKPLTSISIILIPFFIVLSVASASIFEIKFFLRTAAKNRISAVVNDAEKLILGVLTVLIPQIAYSVMFLTTFDHGLSLSIMSVIVLAELALSTLILRRS